MTKKKRTVKLRPANDVLTPEQLSKSRIAKIPGSSLLFLVSPQILADQFATRHLIFLTSVGKSNVCADGLLRARYWTVNFFDPSDWYTQFKKLDVALAEVRAARESKRKAA